MVRKTIVEKPRDLTNYKDTLRGRPVRLNRQRLNTNDRGYASLIAFGDSHWGHPQSDVERSQRMLEYCLEHEIYLICMGDLMESGLTTSVGDSVYQQKLNPQEQMEFTIEQLEPLANRGLILGYLMGNHELRIRKRTGVDISKAICRILKVPYLNYACWNLFYVGKQSYSIYAWHGASAARYSHTRLKAVTDITRYISADCILMAHTHSLMEDSCLVQVVNRTKKKVVEKKVHVILTGSYLTWDLSYAQEKGYSIPKLGSPKIKLFADKRDIHISI